MMFSTLEIQQVVLPARVQTSPPTGLRGSGPSDRVCLLYLGAPNRIANRPCHLLLLVFNPFWFGLRSWIVFAAANLRGGEPSGTGQP